MFGSKKHLTIKQLSHVALCNIGKYFLCFLIFCYYFSGNISHIARDSVWQQLLISKFCMRFAQLLLTLLHSCSDIHKLVRKLCYCFYLDCKGFSLLDQIMPQFRSAILHYRSDAILRIHHLFLKNTHKKTLQI